MDDEKRVRGFLDLYQQQMQQFRDTRGTEWKASIGFWTLLAGANYFVAQHPFSVPFCCAFFICLLTVVMHGWWLVMIHRSEQFDRKLWVHYRKEALQCLRSHDANSSVKDATALPPPEDEDNAKRGFGRELLWLVPELWLTIALSALLYWFLTGAGVRQR